jgi:hypothetical protein
MQVTQWRAVTRILTLPSLPIPNGTHALRAVWCKAQHMGRRMAGPEVPPAMTLAGTAYVTGKFNAQRKSPGDGCTLTRCYRRRRLSSGWIHISATFEVSRQQDRQGLHVAPVYDARTLSDGFASLSIPKHCALPI